MSGFALNKDGREVAGMGIAVGDYLNNGRVDVLLTDFSDDFKILFRNDGDAASPMSASASGSRDVDPVSELGEWGSSTTTTMAGTTCLSSTATSFRWPTTRLGIHVMRSGRCLFRNTHDGKFD